MIKLTIDKYIDGRGISRYWLSKATGIQYPVIDKYYKNTVVRYDSYVLDRICAALDCDITDILCYEKIKDFQLPRFSERCWKPFIFLFFLPLLCRRGLFFLLFPPLLCRGTECLQEGMEFLAPCIC